jgi:hypothetical protein
MMSSPLGCKTHADALHRKSAHSLPKWLRSYSYRSSRQDASSDKHIDVALYDMGKAVCTSITGFWQEIRCGIRAPPASKI